jgi:hypothetical protein
MRPALAAVASNRIRFLREAQSVAALNHDHIVPIYHVGEDRQIPFIAMPLLKGETLDHRLRRERRLPVAEALRIGREVAEGLAEAHAVGLVHRDIKPANIWLEAPRGRVRLLDFGLARPEADLQNLTVTGAVVGTPAFMSPEQAQGDPIDARSDLFSLGCVLYRSATGSSPFPGRSPASILAAVLTAHPRPPRTVEPAVPATFSALILRLLAKDPERRPPSALAVAEAIAGIERATPPANPPVVGGQGTTVTMPPVGADVLTPVPTRIKPEPRRSTGKGVVLGCGIAAFCLFLMVVVGGFFVASRVVSWVWGGVQSHFEEERAWDEVARTWRPPPADDVERIFPQAVGDFRRSQLDSDLDIPDLGFQDLEGHHARYDRGEEQVDVIQLEASSVEKEDLFKQALATIQPEQNKGVGPSPGKRRHTSSWVYGSAESPRVSSWLGPGDLRGVLWYHKGWLFVARTDGVGDPEAFLKRYLPSISAHGKEP